MAARGALSRYRGGVASVSNSSGILQQTVCPRNSDFLPHLLANIGMTREALLFGRLAKMYRDFNCLVTGQTATDPARFFGSSLGRTLHTLEMRYQPASRPLAPAWGWQVFRSGLTIRN